MFCRDRRQKDGLGTFDLRGNMDHRDDVYIGSRIRWGGQSPCVIRAKDRRQHVYTIGQTGVGKSTLLRNLILQDIALGHGVGLIDPHGDLADDILNHIPSWRVNDVVYFDPSDRKYPIGVNLLHDVHPDKRHLVASGVVSAFRSIWGDSWGPRMEYILHAAVAALLDCQNASILGIQRMLVDAKYRQWVVKQVKDPAVRAFWTLEFPNYDKRFAAEAIAPIQNKVGQLVLAPPIRNIFGQVRSAIDARFMMDQQRIFIASLSKGRLGHEKANLLGAIFLTLFQLAAMERADISEAKRRDFYLYVDEFHNFSTDTFASVLSEARKYRLGLTLSHQYVAQLPENIRDAIFGNVGTLISFRVGEADAAILSRRFGDKYVPKHFTDLSNHTACVKLLQGGEYGEPFIARTIPPIDLGHNRRESIIRTSRQRYGTPRHIVEDRINRWID